MVQEADLLYFARKDEDDEGASGPGVGWRRIWLAMTINALTVYSGPSKVNSIARGVAMHLPALTMCSAVAPAATCAR